MTTPPWCREKVMVYYYYVVPYTYVWCCPQPYAWFCPQHLLMAWSPTLPDDVVPNTYGWCCPQHLRMVLSPTLTHRAGFIGGRWGQLPLGPPVRPPMQVWNLQMWTVSLTHTGHIVTYYHYYALAALPFNMPMVRK